MALLANGATLDRLDVKVALHLIILRQLTSPQGKTSYDIAQQHGHSDCASFLKKEGADALLNYQGPHDVMPACRLDKGYEIDRYGWIVPELNRGRQRSFGSSSSLTGSSSSIGAPGNTRGRVRGLARTVGFGFTHRLLSQRSTSNKKMEMKDAQREKKWKEMLSCWNIVRSDLQQKENLVEAKYQKKLRLRILKGIPNRLRGQVWSQLSQSEKKRDAEGSIYDTV